MCSGRYQSVQTLDACVALDGLGVSRAGRSGCSGQVRGVQSLDACVALDGIRVSRVNANLKVYISSSPGGPTNSERYTRGSNQSSRIVWRSGA